jgi:hypothetical protein
VGVSAEQLAAELRAFDGRRQVVQAMRRGLTRSAAPAIERVRAHALAILPQTGGLAAWVAKARIGFRISYGARTAGVRLRGGRKSLTDRSDLQGIDAGKVRRPSWGRRHAGQWHTQSVAPGWWSTPLGDDEQFVDAVDAEVDRVLEQIRRG